MKSSLNIAFKYKLSIALLSKFLHENRIHRFEEQRDGNLPFKSGLSQTKWSNRQQWNCPQAIPTLIVQMDSWQLYFLPVNLAKPGYFKDYEQMGISTAFCWNETVDETMTLLLLLLTCK